MAGGRTEWRSITPDVVMRLVLLDIASTLAMYEPTMMAFATACFYWFFLTCAAPFPELAIGANPNA